MTPLMSPTDPQPVNQPQVPVAVVAQPVPALTTSVTDIADAFDPPFIEEVDFGIDAKDPEKRKRIIVRVPFARADMDYWSAWALQLKEKRRLEWEKKLNAIKGLDPLTRAEASRNQLREEIGMVTLLNQQYTPDGIKKLLLEGMERAGIRNAMEREKIRKRIYPARQQAIAGEICSEPRPTIDALRDAIRERASKMGMLAHEVAALSDEDLIRIARTVEETYKPSPQDDPTAGTFGGAGGAVPLTPGGAQPGESTGDLAPPSFDITSPE